MKIKDRQQYLRPYAVTGCQSGPAEWGFDEPAVAAQLKRVCGTLREAQVLVGTYVRFNLADLEKHLDGLISASDLDSARTAIDTVSDDDLRAVYRERFPNPAAAVGLDGNEAPDA